MLCLHLHAGVGHDERNIRTHCQVPPPSFSSRLWDSRQMEYTRRLFSNALGSRHIAGFLVTFFYWYSMTALRRMRRAGGLGGSRTYLISYNTYLKQYRVSSCSNWPKMSTETSREKPHTFNLRTREVYSRFIGDVSRPDFGPSARYPRCSPQGNRVDAEAAPRTHTRQPPISVLLVSPPH
jgi:hypothetical protein